MASRIAYVVLTAFAAALIAGCGIHFLGDWDGRPTARRTVAAPPPDVWQHVSSRIDELGLTVEEIRPTERIIQLGWMTMPGDGRAYLECSGSGVVGSASIRPRIHIREDGNGSIIVLGTQTRATGATTCASTGEFESWLLERMEPAVLAAERDASDRNLVGLED